MAAKKKSSVHKAPLAKKIAKARREKPAAKPARAPVAKAAPAAATPGGSGLVYTSALRELLARRLGR